MTRKIERGSEIVVASHNKGKVREIRDLLQPYGLQVTSARELGFDEPVEDGKTYTANARIKSEAIMKASGRLALADDSGLSVDILDGDPGIHSARWAGPGRDFGKAMLAVNQAIHDASDSERSTRRAAFICVLSLCWPDGHFEDFHGRVEGILVWPPRGELGFGYDPMFVPNGETETFGEMDPQKKHAMSHRADAFRKLVDACLAKA